MAITYSLKINKLGGDMFAIGAQITDDTKMPEYQTESVTIWGKLDTPEHRESVWNLIKTQYLVEVAATADIAALEAEGKAYLEGIL